MSILAAINYTAGSKPYGYRGLGDLAVLIFFGFVGVGGTYFLQTRSIDLVSLLPALSCGLFATGVLNINNIRDIESDKIAGKISIPVRLGREKAVMYHWIIITTGFLSSVVFVLLNFTNISEWIFLITLPFFFINAKAVYTNHEPKSIDPYLKQLSLTTLAFVITFGAGLLIANWIS